MLFYEWRIVLLSQPHTTRIHIKLGKECVQWHWQQWILFTLTDLSVCVIDMHLKAGQLLCQKKNYYEYAGHIKWGFSLDGQAISPCFTNHSTRLECLRFYVEITPKNKLKNKITATTMSTKKKSHWFVACVESGEFISYYWPFFSFFWICFRVGTRSGK